MPRVARAVFAGLPHHVTQRGNRREDVFFTNEDRRTYLDWLKAYCNAHAVEILAYRGHGGRIGVRRDLMQATRRLKANRQDALVR